MTEAEWWACGDYEAMKAFLTTPRDWKKRWLGWLKAWPHSPEEAAARRRLSRKLILLACARFRYTHALFKSQEQISLRAAEVVERFADGEATADEVAAAKAACDGTRPPGLLWLDDPLTDMSAALTYQPAWQLSDVCTNVLGGILDPDPLPVLDARLEAQVWGQLGWKLDVDRRGLGPEARHRYCEQLRELFGNPFRVTRLDPASLSWNGQLAVNLARDAYDRRCFTDLPILADALEDAGCADAELLGHLRGPGPHVRGCWALDLVLGKE